MRYAALALVIASIASSTARAEMDLRYDIVLLADPVAAKDDKLSAVDELTNASLAAVPSLIERLHDTSDAVFADDVVVETGPMNPGPPATVRTTARFMCELALYRIIAPEPGETSVALGARASKTGLDAVRPAGGIELSIARPPIAWVRDWDAFWSAHKKESIDVIKRWSADEINRAWKSAALASPTAPAQKPGDVPHLAVSTMGTAATLASTSAGILLTAWNDPALSSARDAYVKSRAIFRDAAKDIGKRPTARKALEDAAKKEPRLKVHVEHWLAQL